MNGSNLRERLEAVNAEIDEKNAVAQAKWSAFEGARSKYAKSGAGGASDPAFKAAEMIHLEYAQAAGELKELEAQRDTIFRALAGDGSAKSAARGHHATYGSIGDRLAQSNEMKFVRESGVLDSDRQRIDAKIGSISRTEMKSLLTGVSDTSAGAFVDAQRVGYVPQPQRAPSIVNLITLGETNSDTVKYARQTTFTNVAAEVAESTTTTTGTKPEASMNFEVVEAGVKTIAHWVPATRRSLADTGQMATLVDRQLRYGLRLRLENQIVNGDGTGENLTGILNTSGILSQAKGSDSVIDAIFKATTQLRLGYVEPSGVLVNPTDWEVIRLAKNLEDDYYFGPPSQAGAVTLWGLPVVVSSVIPDDTALVGDFSQSALWTREDAQVLVSDSHDDFFTKNLLAILCEGRWSHGVLMPSAFAKVTGVDA